MASKSSYNRYSSGTTPSARSTSSHVEPSTCGTSWTSVRWSKPTSGYRGHSSRLASTFEPASSSSLAKTPSYSLSPAGSRPSSSRTSANDYASSYTRSSLASNTSTAPTASYRSRDIFSPSRFQGASSYDSRDYMSKKVPTTEPTRRSTSQSLASKTPMSAKMLPTFTTPSKPIYENESSSLAISKAMLKPIPKSERPWRQRMADAARLREDRGFDTNTTTKLVESRARRNSIGHKSGDELQTSLNALKDLVCDSTVDKNSALSKYRMKTSGSTDLRTSVSPSRVTFRTVPSATIHLRAAQLMSESYSGGGLTLPYTRPSNVMSRSYSPIRTSRSPIWSGSSAFSNRDSTMPYTSRYSARDKSYETSDKGIKPITQPTETTIDEERKPRAPAESKEQASEKRVNPRSSRERTARRNSRQRSQSKSLSRVSSDEDAAPTSRDPPKKRRLRKRTASLPRENEKPTKDENATSTIVNATNSDTIAAKLPPTNVPETNQEAVNSSMYETPNDEDEPINNIIVNAKKEKEDYVESFDKTEEEFKSALSSLEILTMGNKSTKEPKQEERQIVPYKKSTVKKKLAEFKMEKERNEIASIAPPEIFIPNDMPKIFNEVSPLSAVSPYSSFSMDAPLARDEISLSETISDTQSLILDDDDETKFNAVAEFKPKHLRRKKSPAPVPGVWIASTDEVNISRNKQLVKKDMEEISIECILAHIPLEQVVSPKIRATRRKLPEENQVLNAGFKCKASTKESAAITILGRKPVVIYKVSAHAREKRKVTPVTAIAVLNKDFANKKRLRLGIEKIFYAKGFKKDLVKLSCKAALNLLTHIKLNVVQNEQAKAANVTVLSSDIMDVNWAHVKQRLKASVAPPTKKTLGEMIEKHAAIIVAEKEKLEKSLLPTKPPSVDEEDISSSSEAPKRFETHASIVLHRLRTADPGLANSNNHLLPSDDYRKGDAIVLPDRSVLEEYVKRKRGQLERLQSEPLHAPSPLFSSRDVSPCHSTTSELQPACAVRIVEPPQRAVALITNPSRDRSRLSSVESTSVPPSSRNSNMLDIASYTEPTIRSNENLIAADFRAALKPRSRDSLIQLAVFDEPKSPFEAHLQNHATNLLRKSSTGTNIPANRVPEDENRDHSVEAILSLSEGQHRRRSSVESITSMPPISAPMLTQTFTQAAALASQPRHERYAAHIPVNRSDTSGRQSTTSIDSNNSSSLDTASRQLDQMIDQARYRHHQHRAKFKEAIDYLDQIFEDLKKECEPPPATAADKKSEVPPPSSRGIQAAKAVFQKPKGQPTSPPTVKLRDQRRANPPLVSTHSLESNIQQQRPQPPPHRPEPIPAQVGTKQPLRQVQPPAQPNPSLPSFTNLHTAGPKPFPKDANNDIEVSETIVLPRKRSDRMDFTQKWLVDDIKSWADNPPTKPDLILNPNNQVWENGNDSDEHSIGSCSAEVAAINASDGRKKKVRETPDIIKSSKQYSAKKPTQTTLQSTNNAGPIRPQPFRPQPQYAFPSTSNTLNPNENNPYYGLQKVPSQDYITAVQQQQERAGSQEYQSIGSVHSQDGYKPPSSLSLLYSNSLNRTGAFIQYPQRGSIQSLPDANLMKPIPQRLPLQDPVLAIDALVAELELNTDQANVEKRRSFPTSSIADTYGSLQREYEKPKTSRPVVPKKPQAPSTLNVIKEPIQAGSMDRGMRRIQQQKASLDEVTNLLSTFANGGELSPSTSSRASLQQQQIPKKIPVKPVVLEKNLLTPFETINAERINPSRVEAMQHMFEAKPQASPSQNSWRKNLPRNTSKDEENYYEINEFTVPTEKVINKTTVNQFSPPSSKSHRQQKDTTIIQPLYSQPNCFEYVPAFPVSQPPPGPPPGTSGSCGSANSGYYSSTSLAGNNPYNSSVSQKERPVSFRKPSISSRNGSFEDEEDDGFYDNIQVDHRRFSRGSELDNTSISSHRLPPTHKSSRLGQLIRRIGGGNSKPPGSAASLVSLNKAGIDHSRPIGLMKSNSLSNEPWNAQFITNKHDLNKKNSQGFGQRLKQSIFGSRKRLNY